MKKDTIILLAVLGVGGYLLYKALSAAKEGAEKAIGAASDVIASAWLKMFPLPPAMQLLGNVKFPGNILVPLQQLANEGAVKKDANDNVYVSYAGYIWKLSPQVYGNWPATNIGATP